MAPGMDRPMGEIASRYSAVTEKMPRELLLLQGRGCFHRACSFCTYWHDTSAAPYAVNKPAIEQVTGASGALDVINSGSAHELDGETLALLADTVREKNIRTVWFESHYAYKDRLDEIRALFPDAHVKFRVGVESFDTGFRERMNKGMPPVTPEEIRKDFEGVCLLVCIQGQTFEQMEYDARTAARLFEYFSVNVFCPNSSSARFDAELFERFRNELYPWLSDLPNCEILIQNTELGVG
jgi:hypothetical protein